MSNTRAVGVGDQLSPDRYIGVDLNVFSESPERGDLPPPSMLDLRNCNYDRGVRTFGGRERKRPIEECDGDSTYDSMETG